MVVLTPLLCLVGIFKLAIGVPVDAPLPLPISDLVFRGELGGHEVEFNGTIQEVYAQVAATHPSFNTRSQLDTNIALAAASPIQITKRNKAHHFCNQNIGKPWLPAKVTYIEDGIKYLSTSPYPLPHPPLYPDLTIPAESKGKCGVQSGHCARISCSWDSAIFLCNDRLDFIEPSCAYLASYAEDLIDWCKTEVSGMGSAVAGQLFDTDSYNVLVRYSNC
ncbi:hypothetical protein GLAREA_05890 [Glarea lozoyensis ATCC 20868]|uniref:Uncharacterized protein n=1 Tax=Glarea lozoyensis (strain ATCC 20868 / MF5171) TaxID=1116229 RepID=S3E374_GLAL2|nr:uncharacterized protein GLAREA_05890 [Glarea lozoyensis ATCC 20868]EPE32878.1 hypothetical protein GLAREA_05890 [Glarea lozoyensis ATCC 20868]